MFGYYMKATIRGLGITCLAASICACSTLSVDDDVRRQLSSDPFEGVNRTVYAFNDKADKLVLRPAAKAYNYVLPKPVKTGVSNFFGNLQEPLNAINNLLQGKFERALASTFRFTVNSTIGVLGIVDVAKALAVDPAKEDFGQTMAAWGVGPGPYLMLPLLGPSNLRDGFGRFSESALYYPISEASDSNSAQLGLGMTSVVSIRVGFLGTDALLDSQLDPYAFLKQAFEQQRIESLYDGNAPTVEQDFDF
ncbi:MAG: phospholipid-binding lipoprotein MlaA [Alteromonas macleodii]|jgi:phospholipid-binding lipoprotein MlaA